MAGLFSKKGGSSAARAARARKGHARRHTRQLAAGQAATHYKGHSRRRTRNMWFVS